VLVAVRKGQRRDAAATGEERQGRFAARKSKYIRLYQHSGKLALAAMNLRRVRVRVPGRSFAVGAPQLTNVFTIGTCGENSSAWASGGPAGGRRVAECLGAMARIALGRDDATHHNAVTSQNCQFRISTDSSEPPYS
jgi:hypothetical protein